MKQSLLLTLVFVVFFAGCKTTKIGKKPASAYKPTIESKVTDVPAKEVAKPLEKKAATVAENSITIRSEEISLASGEDQTQGNYAFYVIVGSFSSNDNARNLKKQLTDKGFTPVIMQNESGMYRVSIKQTNSEADAREMITELRANFEQHKDAWLLKKK